MSLVHQHRSGGTAVITLNEPRRRNILSMTLSREFVAAIDALGNDDSVKAIIITGAPPAFCAGADLEDLEAARDGRTEALHAVYAAFMAVAESRVPTIAAVNGPAVGAGLNLALACDIRIASADAVFDTRFLKIGLHPGGGHGWMLLRAVGWAEASRMLLLDRPLRADEALAARLVQQVEQPDKLAAAALELARRTEALPRALIVQTKDSLRRAAVAGHQMAFDQEAEAQMHSLHQPPFRALVERMKTTLGNR